MPDSSTIFGILAIGCLPLLVWTAIATYQAWRYSRAALKTAEADRASLCRLQHELSIDYALSMKLIEHADQATEYIRRNVDPDAREYLERYLGRHRYEEYVDSLFGRWVQSKGRR